MAKQLAHERPHESPAFVRSLRSRETRARGHHQHYGRAPWQTIAVARRADRAWTYAGTELVQLSQRHQPLLFTGIFDLELALHEKSFPTSSLCNL
jgi:hypothetical protein